MFVYLVDELGAVVDHLFHGERLGEPTVFAAVAAVVKVGGAVGVGGAVVVFGEWHGATLAKLWQLALLQVFFLFWKSCLVLLKLLGLGVGYEITLGRLIGALDTGEIALFEFLGKEVGHFAFAWFGMVVYLEC